MNTAPREVQDWFRLRLFDAVPTSIAVIDRDYRVVMANHCFEEHFGAWRGRLCWEVYKGCDRRCDNCPAESVFRDGEVSVRQEIGRNCEGEEAHYLVHVAPVRRRADGTISFCVEMSTDITDLHRVEQQKLEAERLAAVGETVAGLAHEIKNIIAGLEGGMYVMETGLKRNLAERLELGWGMLTRNVDRISTLARNLLAYSKGHEPDVGWIDPVQLARGVTDLYHDAAAQIDVELTLEIEGEIPIAPLDESQIHGGLANLVSNAVDACQMSDRDVGHVTLRVRDTGDALEFEVQDDGIGMDVEVKRKLFTTFFTTKGSSGTGLGLLQVRKAVQEHGGKVTVESEFKRGTLFRIHLPWASMPRPHTDDEREDGEDRDG